MKALKRIKDKPLTVKPYTEYGYRGKPNVIYRAYHPDHYNKIPFYPYFRLIEQGLAMRKDIGHLNFEVHITDKGKELLQNKRKRKVKQD